VKTVSWVSDLKYMRERPAMFLGKPDEAQLDNGVRALLRLVWEKEAFRGAQRAHCRVSPNQYHVRSYSGPLRPEIEELIEWEDCDDLMDRTASLRDRLMDPAVEWAHRFREPTFQFGQFAANLSFARRGAFAIRLSTGLWCQIFRDGWPQGPPFRCDASPDIGLMSAAALSDDWFKGLPMTLAQAEEAVPEVARPYVTLDWHEEDDLVPECPVHPQCILHQENLPRWL
jgi:hypothetical protein